MALSVHYPIDPLLSGLGLAASDVCGSAVGDFGSLSCGLNLAPLAHSIKSEPLSPEENMDESSSSSCLGGVSSTFTELSSATLASIKHSTADMYSESPESPTFRSWTYSHPEHWEAREVLDWLFALADSENFDGALFRGEAYNALTGRQLCGMSLGELVLLDPNYGARVYEVLQWMKADADFLKPCPADSFKSEKLGNVPDFACLECPSDVTVDKTKSLPTGPNSLNVVLNNGKEMQVRLHGLGLYDIDITINGNDGFDQVFSDSDYNSDHNTERSHSVSSDVFDPTFSDDDTSDARLPPLCKRVPSSTSSTSSSHSDSGCEGEEKQRSTPPRRRQTSASKGNHLWEFVRDLLRESQFNPSLLKWEDKELGVFKFVQSEAVAQMWGRKKNNPAMTYEKLSRAMRFCRTAGYFDSVPKTGRFPKKLCFKFGGKAHDWRD